MTDLGNTFGAIYAKGAPTQVTIDGLMASGNSAPSGAVLAADNGASVTLSEGELTSNIATVAGGAVYCNNCFLTVSTPVFLLNSCQGASCQGGGAVFVGGASNATFNGTQFLNNTGTFGGGANVNVANSSYAVTFTDCTFEFNLATSRGGAIYSSSTSFSPSTEGNYLSRNVALLSGNTLAGPPITLDWASGTAPVTVQNVSGVYLPDFTVLLRDTYNITVFLGTDQCLILKTTVWQNDTLVVAETVGEIQKALLDGQASFSSVRVTGSPGTYTVVTASSVPSFNPSEFRLSFQATIDTCPAGKILQPLTGSDFPVCVDAVCTQGCLYGVCVNTGVCQCLQGFAGNSCSYQDTAPYYPAASSPEGTAIAVIAGLMIGVAIFFAVSIIIFRETPVIKSSSPVFCVLTIFGMILAYLAVFTYIGLPSTALCTSNLWLLNIAFALTFGNILAKNWRIYKIFHNHQLRLSTITTRFLLLCVAALLAVEILLLIIWSGYDAPSFVEIDLADGVRYYECGGKNSTFSAVLLAVTIIYNSIITFAAAWLAFKTRKVSSAFRESASIAVSVYNFAVISVIIILLIYASGTTFSAQAVFLLKSVGVLIVTSFGLLALFGPKIYILYFAKGQNVLPRDKLMKQFHSKNNFLRSDSNVPMSASNLSVNADALLREGSEIPSMAGMLVMQVGVFKVWKPRFVELHAQAGVLTLFESEDREQIGRVLSMAKVGVMVREDVSPGCFMLQSEREAVILQASDKQASDAWIAKINAVRRNFMSDEDKRRLQETQNTSSQAGSHPGGEDKEAAK